MTGAAGASPPPALVVIGASAGGIAAMNALLAALPAEFPLPMVLVQHIKAGPSIDFARVLRVPAGLRVREAEEKTAPERGWLDVAPPGYHLLVERDRTFALSVDERVNWSRPSIDVLFESAAAAYGAGLVGVILTGANHDGAAGLRTVAAGGGRVAVQAPETAELPTMPAAALAAVPTARALPLATLAAWLAELAAPAVGAAVRDRGGR